MGQPVIQQVPLHPGGGAMRQQIAVMGQTQSFVQTFNPQNYSKWVKLQQPDGSWAVAPVQENAPQVQYMHVRQPDGTIVLQQVIREQPGFKRHESLNTFRAFGADTLDSDGEKVNKPWTLHSYDTLHDDGDLIYTSSSKSDCYFWTRWLWCACCEPMHTVTTKYVESETWVGCSKESDSKAMDIFDDADLTQTCFQHCWNTCGCCCVDHGTITLVGADRSKWTLEKIHNANETFDKIQKHLAKIRQERKDKREGKKTKGK